RRDIQALRQAFHPEATEHERIPYPVPDAARIAAFVTRGAEGAVARAASRGSVDVVRDLVNPVTVSLCGEYLGTPAADVVAQVLRARDLHHEMFFRADQRQPIAAESYVTCELWSDEVQRFMDRRRSGTDPRK